jgi:hypothetical protein
MMYLNQFRAVKCFLEKIAMVDNVICVPQNMDCEFRVPSLVIIYVARNILWMDAYNHPHAANTIVLHFRY